MKFLVFAMTTLTLLFNVYAADNVKTERKPSSTPLHGKLATELFELLSTSEGDCGAGHCWAGGKVSCRLTNATKKVVCTNADSPKPKEKKGSHASELLNYLSSPDGDCGAGHCWAEGKISCRMTNETKKVECTKE